MRTVFSGLSNFAVSAMKCTPARTITSASTVIASAREGETVADKIGDAMENLRSLIIMRKHHRVAAALQRHDGVNVLRVDRPLDRRDCMAHPRIEGPPRRGPAERFSPRTVYATSDGNAIALYSH